ncbi:MAG: HAD-IA family hydrolase [Planctomycetota bacterium]|nr:HAD-IA family hydrolase [Planctomycetota bacterium]
MAIPSKRRLQRLDDIQVVFFDVGGTLIYNDLGHLDLLHQALLVIGYRVTRDEVVEANDLARRAVARSRRRYPARMDTGAASRMWLDHLAAALDLDLASQILEQELARAIRLVETRSPETLDPDAHYLLRNLRKREFRLGVISNWGEDLPEYLTSFGLAGYFETVIASEAVGTSKPHREIFLRGLSALGARPQQAVHVGDDYWADVVGARSIGIHPVLVDRDGEDTHADCPTIARLGDLAALL